VDRYHSCRQKTEETLDNHPAIENGGGAEGERPSKSALKREMLALQVLGQKLVALTGAQLAKLPLTDSLRLAIVQTQKVTAHEARRRQMQYIGKLMRTADHEAIRSAYDELMGGSLASVALMHQCERLRERLIDDDAALGEFVEQNAGVDTQWLRAKVRAARLERSAAKPPRHARELYKWLYAHLHGAAAADAAGTA
jgi:ribosome-associated protein